MLSELLVTRNTRLFGWDCCRDSSPANAFIDDRRTVSVVLPDNPEKYRLARLENDNFYCLNTQVRTQGIFSDLGAVLSGFGRLLQFRHLLNHLVQLTIHGFPLFASVIGINASGNSNNNSCDGNPEVGALEGNLNPLKEPTQRCEHKLVGYRYVVSGAACIFAGFLLFGAGFMGMSDNWHFGVAAIICAALILIAAWKLINHGMDIVTQKCLTTIGLCNTIIDMANVLNPDKQIAIIGALAEGSSIRSIERMTGVHRDTIMRLGVKVGQGCTALLDEKMRNLPCRLLQFDEVWGFIGKKERHVRPDDDPQYGDVWTFCAIDAETKLVPSFKCGKRDLATAKAFVSDVQNRMANRVQISADALRAYVDAIEQTFGADVDFGQIVKTYEHDDSQNAERKYSAAKFVFVEKRSVTGLPDMDLVSTSYIERLNATTRLHMRRLTRLTLAFSKKLENFEAAVGLHFAYYNLVKCHNSLRCTPAMAAGVERDFWTVGDLIEAAA